MGDASMHGLTRQVGLYLLTPGASTFLVWGRAANDG
jgi:hypothetical protein